VSIRKRPRNEDGYEEDYSMPSGITIPPSLVKKTTSVGSPGPARLTAVTFAENGTKAPGKFK